jgi:hypothetical protein
VQDNSKGGHTGDVLLEAVKLDGTRLWHLDLGCNIRAGAHYTQFMVADFDLDGVAETILKTAPGTKDASGNYLSKGVTAGADHSRDYRNSDGYVLSGPEWLTVFGADGRELARVDYVPVRGNVSSWGDGYGNVWKTGTLFDAESAGWCDHYKAFNSGWHISNDSRCPQISSCRLSHGPLWGCSRSNCL